MSITTKIVATGASLSAIGGGGYVINHFLNRDTLGKALENKGHTLLNFDINNTNEKGIWTTIVNAYVAGTKKFEKLPTITINSSVTDENINSLKNACAEAINSWKYENTELLTAEQWCTKPISIKSLVEKYRKVLDSANSSNEHESEWDVKVTSYLQENAKHKMESVKLVTITQDNKKTERDKLKKGCEDLKETKTHDKDFHTKYEQFQEWCTTPKS